MSNHRIARAKTAPGKADAASSASTGIHPPGMAIGNQAMQHALQSGAIRAKLAVGGANDAAELEADRMAEMATGTGPPVPDSVGSSYAKTIVRPRHDDGPSVSEAPPAVASVLSSPGRPLEQSSRANMEQSFGRDFRDVRVHTGDEANASAREINALAYTFGRNIVFARGQYAPHSQEGRQLIAHELAHVAQGGAAIRRQPDKTAPGDRPVLGRVRRSDIASRGKPGADWSSQFAAPKPPVTPEHVSSIKAAQDWVDDLGGFERDEGNRYKVGDILKSMIERLPPDVLLPRGDVIGRSSDKDSSLTVVEGGTWVKTDALRNKLYTMYVAVEKPAEIEHAERDPTGLLWDMDIEQFVTDEDKQAQEKYGIAPDPQPYELNRDAFTRNELDSLEFLFPDEMLEWRRRDVEVQDSVDREHDRRIGEFMAALGDVSIRAIEKFFEFSALAGTGMAAAGPLAARIGAAFGIENLAAAPWLARIGISAGTGSIIGGGTSALDSAITNAPDLVTGKMSAGEYFSGIGSSTVHGAKWGGAFGAGGEILGPVLGPIKNFFLPESPGPVSFGPNPAIPEPAPPASVPQEPAAPEPAAPKAAAPEPAAPEPETPEPAATGPKAPPKTNWLMRRLRDVLVKFQLGVAEPEVLPDMQIGYAGRDSGALVEGSAGRAARPAPAPSPETPAPVAEQVAPTPTAQQPTAAPSAQPTPVVPAPAPAQQSEAQQRVAVVDQAQAHVTRIAQEGQAAIAAGDPTPFLGVLYPGEIARVMRGDPRAFGVYVEWRAREAFALDPFLQPHIGRGGYLGRRWVEGRPNLDAQGNEIGRAGFADFFGTVGGLLSNIPIDITTERGLAPHLDRYYLKRGLIFTYPSLDPSLATPSAAPAPSPAPAPRPAPAGPAMRRLPGGASRGPMGNTQNTSTPYDVSEAPSEPRTADTPDFGEPEASAHPNQTAAPDQSVMIGPPGHQVAVSRSVLQILESQGIVPPGTTARARPAR